MALKVGTENIQPTLNLVKCQKNISARTNGACMHLNFKSFAAVFYYI